MEEYPNDLIYSKFMSLLEASIELKRHAGCMCLEYETEDYGIEILKKISRNKYSLVDIFKALKTASIKCKNEINKKGYLSAGPLSEKQYDKLIESL